MRPRHYFLWAITALLLYSPAYAGSSSFTWTAPTRNVDGSALTNLAGYRIYYGTSPRNYTDYVTISDASRTSAEVHFLPDGVRLYFAMTALNTLGEESTYSNEVYRDMPAAPPPIYEPPGPPLHFNATWAFAEPPPTGPPEQGNPAMWKDVRFYQSTDGASPRTITLTEQPEVGDEMVILQWVPSWQSDRTGFSVSDSAGNVWSADTTITPDPTNTHRHIFWRATIDSVPSTISVAWTAGAGIAAYLLVGIVDSSLTPLTFGDSDYWTAGFSSADFGVTLTTDQDDELAIGWFNVGAATTFDVVPTNLQVASQVGDWHSLYSDSLGVTGDQDISITNRSAGSQNYMVAAAYRTSSSSGTTVEVPIGSASLAGLIPTITATTNAPQYTSGPTIDMITGTTARVRATASGE